VGIVQSALDMGGCGFEMFVSATFSLRFAKAGSAATVSQQEKNNSEDLQRGGFFSSRRRAFGDFESLANSFAAGTPPPIQFGP
jgi:hypothetical protein